MTPIVPAKHVAAVVWELRGGVIMQFNRWIRWCLPVMCILVIGIASEKANASPLLGQPGLAKAVAPTMAGWHHRYYGWGGGWGGYRGGWGSYYYGRPWIYSAYRPYYANRFVGAYGYGYGYASPYYSGFSYASPYYSTGYYGIAAYRPVVYAAPAYTSYYVQPTVYPAAYYAGYGGYSAYSYPSYSMYGYTSYAPYGACCGYW